MKAPIVVVVKSEKSSYSLNYYTPYLSFNFIIYYSYSYRSITSDCFMT